MFRVCKNDEGIYRVRLYTIGETGLKQDGWKPNEGCWMRDTDLMLAVSSNHVSKILNFNFESQAYRAVADYLEKLEMVQQYNKFNKQQPVEPVVSETFREL